tara:strand:+ start:89 stop:1621 length:1533 start_codon:yes stop_codon:yes gene_type:complete
MAKKSKSPLEEMQERTREENSRTMDDDTFNDLFKAGDYDLILMDGGADLAPWQMAKMKAKGKQDSEEKLQKMAYDLALSPGYQEMMLLPIMSKMMPQVFSKNDSRGNIDQKEQPVDTQSKDIKSEQEETSVKEDIKHTKIGPETSQSLRVNDSEADILGKMFNFMKRDYEFRSNMENDKEKYRKEVAERKDAYTDQLIEALTGKKPAKSKKSGATSKKFGLLKYAALGAAGAGAFMLSKSALANIDWKAMLPDFDFSKTKTDGEGTDGTGGISGTGAMGGAAAGDWKNDTEFLNNVNKYAQEKGIKASDLLSVMAAESRIDPTAVNKKSGATGLIQFTPDTAKGLGTSTEELRKMSRSQQFEYVKKHLDQAGLKSGSSGGEIYAKVFLPGRSKSEILTKQGENYYEANKGLDVDKSGDISKTDLEKVSQLNKKRYNIEDMSPSQTAVQSEPVNKDTTIPQKIKVTPKKPTQVSVIGNNTNIVNGATNYNVAGSTNNNNAALVDKQYFNYG